MSTQFDRPLFGFRFAGTEYGDTLQAIAARELGDASRWVDLITYNKLVPPFITDDASEAGPGVLLTGSPILVPAPAPASSLRQPDAAQAFGADMQLDARGVLMTDGNDFVIVAGAANLTQALKNRVVTERGDLLFHLLYGCDLRRIVGTVNGPTANLLAARSVKKALLQDRRVSTVRNAQATVSGDTINVTANADSVVGAPVQVNAAV